MQWLSLTQPYTQPLFYSTTRARLAESGFRGRTFSAELVWLRQRQFVVSILPN